MGGSETYVALLRGINVGGHNRVSMTDLRGLLGRLGFTDVRSLLQSGNLVLRAGARPVAEMERRFEAEAQKHLGLGAAFFVRTAQEWDAVVASNPFPEAAERDPSHLAVVFLRTQPAAGDVDALRQAIKGRELVRPDGRQLYAFYPDGMGRSRLTNDLIERKLAGQGTARNWNTILKVQALAKS